MQHFNSNHAMRIPHGAVRPNYFGNFAIFATRNLDGCRVIKVDKSIFLRAFIPSVGGLHTCNPVRGFDEDKDSDLSTAVLLSDAPMNVRDYIVCIMPLVW